uniref:nicotinate-nucleotide diphosphorylase (carboxylating) n=1 Tax=Salix viminalis TaxID=40686 RepID=A0A6N2KWR9_SALVM
MKVDMLFTIKAPGKYTIMSRIVFSSPSTLPQLYSTSRRIVKMSVTQTMNSGVSFRSMAVKPPSHPTYDMKGVIKLALLKIWDQVEWSQKDGDHVQKGLQFGKVSGQAHNIVVAERVVLNFMQRMSGIATLTKTMADAAHPACILETRKTAPGLRLVDKWAVLIGGGRNHRMGLFDMVMIKDNHISIAGGIINAIKSVDQYLEQQNLQMEVEVETRTLEEVDEVLRYTSQTKSSLTRIMLDNMVVPLPNGDVDVSMLKDAVEMINGRFETEASGNVTLETVHKIGQTGVSYISSGALTHSVKALDISLKIDTELALKVGRRTKRA